MPNMIDPPVECKLRIGITGAGRAGLAAGVALSRDEHSVFIYEAAPQPTEVHTCDIRKQESQSVSR